jgi:competence protein ComEC
MLPRVPFISFVLFFIAGIVLSEYCLSASFASLSVVTCLLVLTAIAAFYFYLHKNDFVSGIFISLFLIFAGSLAYLLQNKSLSADEKTITNANYSVYEATIKSLPEKRSKSIRMEALITRIRADSTWIKVNLKVLISFPADASVIPQPGDCLIVRGKLDRAAKALNPKEFDYRQYLWNKGIVWTDYLNKDSYYLVPANKSSFDPGLWSLQISEWASRKFRENIKNDRSYGLVKAMLLGRRDDLRSDQVDDYTTSGTVHILSVSGMHVAILFLVISMALRQVHLSDYCYRTALLLRPHNRFASLSAACNVHVYPVCGCRRIPAQTKFYEYTGNCCLAYSCFRSQCLV